MNKKQELHIVLPLVGALAFIIVLHFMGLSIFVMFPQEIIEPIIGVDDDFTAFALLANFAYELIPQTLQQVGIGAVSTVLLIRGFSPWAFGFVIALGKLTGQYIIYFAFRIGFHHRKKGFGSLASANHALHKYHYIAFAFAPWISIGGDALMAVAGHQRISPLKILPILFITDLAEAYKWVFWTLAQLEVTDIVDDFG